MGREPEALEAFFAELELAAGADARYDDALALLRKELTDAAEPPVPGPPGRRTDGPAAAGLAAAAARTGRGRRRVLRSRLAGDWGGAFGTLPAGVDTAAILDRAS